MEFDLAGKTAIVTGASQGIGREIARALHREGVGLANHCGKRDSWMLKQHVLNRRRVDVVTPTNYEVFGATGDPQVAVFIEAPQVTFAPIGEEWSAQVAQWYRNFGVPGTPGAAARSDGEDLGTFTPIPVSSPARQFLEQVDTVLDVLQTAREKRARELRRKATVVSTELECPGCHHKMEPPQRACPNCGKPLGSGFQNSGAATMAMLELGPGQADRFNSFQKLQVITPYGEIPEIKRELAENLHSWCFEEFGENQDEEFVCRQHEFPDDGSGFARAVRAVWSGHARPLGDGSGNRPRARASASSAGATEAATAEALSDRW